ncbi:L,D-transpeptidase OS=Streptomyces alboniger OX=132473 GN=CP975_21215 PE=4 SV=1 [Streptomyces alboniger]
MSRSSSGFVAGLTAAALAAVGFLAYQASASAPDGLAKPPSKSPAASASRSPEGKADPAAVPPRSGAGERVVYSLGADRVWLIEASGKVRSSYKVTPGSVDPAPGTYTVGSRTGSVTGTDGVAIEHVVRFTNTDGITIGFSAAVDGSTPKADPSKKTGGIRQSRENGNAMWEFAGISDKVVVVP